MLRPVTRPEGGAGMAELPGKALAEELAAASRDESRTTPIEDVIAAARSPGLDDDAVHRLVSRLWVLERMFYYVYGGWGQGLEINDFPASIKYLMGAGARDQRLPGFDQIPVLKTDRRRVDARDALSRHAVASRMRQDAKRGVP